MSNEQISTAKERNKKDIVKTLHPLVKTWFFNKFKDFSPTQKYGVLSIHERKNILISAPTGGTKTLTAFLSILNHLVTLSEKNKLEDKVYAIYSSPLKALSNDIHKNLIEPLEEINELAKSKNKTLQQIRVGLRTGDTTAYERQKMAKNIPHILITTPESLSIVLTTKKFVDAFRDVEFCVVDEIHALGNKRGVYLSLSLERLNEMSKTWPVKIGLSATVEPLEEVALFLVGIDNKSKNRKVQIAKVPFGKKLDIDVLSPVKDLIMHENPHKEMYHLIHDLVKDHKTTLIFTNTRAATERVVNYLKDKYPIDYYDSNIAAHHSSLSKEHRFDIEERLRNGSLKVVVCSTSLELGIDIGFIDLVILLGSPKASSRALQRCLPYDSPILCKNGKYIPIGEIVEKKLPLKVISYDKKKGFVKNKIKIYHKNNSKELIEIKLTCGEKIQCTKEHPLLTSEGWKDAKKIKKGDNIAEVRNKIDFNNKNIYLFELLPKDKIFVQNKDDFFQKIIDKYRKKENINAKTFSEKFGMPYSRFIDCRRLKGRRKSIRLDYFLKACKLCNIPEKEYIHYLSYLKTKGTKLPKWPLKLTEELMWLAGIVATDGCIVKSQKKGEAEYYKIKIGNKSKIMINKLTEIVNKFYIDPYIKLKKGICHFEFGSNIIAYLLMSLGIPCKQKTFNININNNIFLLPNNLIHAYLEGIFEGDGNLNIVKNNSSGTIRIFTASKKFAQGLHLLFSRLGYNNTINKSKIKTSKLIKKVSNNYLYCITLCRKEDLKQFFESILCYGDKAKKGKLLTKDFKPYLSLRKDYNKLINYSEVVSVIIKKTNEKVYNLTLEKEPNNFIVNNIIVHNCGRAGHQLHETAKGRFIVMDRDDLVECSVIQKEMLEGKIDNIQFPHNCLDVLSQQIYGMAIHKIWKIDKLLKTIRKSYCYSKLSKDDFFSVISYLSGDYGLEENHVYGKIWYDKETGEVGKRGMMARVIYMTNIGTIPEESFVTVKKAPDGEKLGMIDELFLGRMKKNDVFVLGGKKYQYAYTRGMNLYVKDASNRNPTIPSWFSESLPLSFESGLEINRFRKLMKEKLTSKESKEEILSFIQKHLYVNIEIAKEIYNYFYQQHKFYEIPHTNLILIEKYIDERDHKKYLLVHSMYGRRVNDAFSRALAYVIGKSGQRDVEIGISDRGFYLSSENMDIEKAIKELNPENVEKILKEAIEKTDILTKRFRHCAARSLMILRSYKGNKKSVRKQQMKSHFLISAVKKISKEFPILNEAKREVLEDLMDIENTKRVLSWIQSGEVKISTEYVKIPSPFALNLILQGHTDLMRIEDKQDFLRRMHNLYMKEIERKSFGIAGIHTDDFTEYKEFLEAKGK